MSVCGRNVLCENDSLLNHGAKIQHPQKPIIRFYTFLAIRAIFIMMRQKYYPQQAKTG